MQCASPGIRIKIAGITLRGPGCSDWEKEPCRAYALNNRVPLDVGSSFAVPMLRYSYLYQPQYEFRVSSFEWRGQDLNLRPRGYEPRELPYCSTPRYSELRTIRYFTRPRKKNNIRTTEHAVADLERQDLNLRNLTVWCFHTHPCGILATLPSRSGQLSYVPIMDATCFP